MSSSPSCRILTISSSVVQAKQLVESIIATSNSAEVPEFQEELKQLPWIISNKYYTAPVHFSLATTSDVRNKDAAGVPACIFAFSFAEKNFRDEFKYLITRLQNSDFEVSIAVSLHFVGVEPPTRDEQDSLEAFFSENGFEYVNGNLNCDMTEESVDEKEGISGLARIVDALSTILWPSMVQMAGSKRAKTRSIVSVPGPPGEEDGLRSLLNGDKGSGDTSALQREMAALEKWLEEGADDDKDPWEGAAQSQTPQVGFDFETSQPVESGFDDNFSDLVSAPPQARVDEDPALPSQADVELMSRRILEIGLSEDTDAGDSQAHFDLSRVLVALETMKEEIAGITDEDEKKKAAAKVALGLVYGLEEE